ncbi:MAG: hypothetical protein Q9228_007571, partial [Teloschistes exilis]
FTVFVPNANKVVESQDKVPHTPITPVTAEGLTPIHKLIKQDAHGLDEISKQRLHRHVQKIASAARISFAECALLQDQSRLLAKINGEAKVRRSTKSLILGKAKVMSYEDLSEARAKRAAAKEKAMLAQAKRAVAKEEKAMAKGKATAGKGKRGRPRKNPAPEASSPEMQMSEVPEPARLPVATESYREPAAQIIDPQRAQVAEPWKVTVAQMIDPRRAPVAQITEPFRAPVARMIWDSVKVQVPCFKG